MRQRREWPQLRSAQSRSRGPGGCSGPGARGRGPGRGPGPGAGAWGLGPGAWGPGPGGRTTIWSRGPSAGPDEATCMTIKKHKNNFPTFEINFGWCAKTNCS